MVDRNMQKNNIDNPDLHLSHHFDPVIIQSAIERVLGVPFTVITDLINFDFDEKKPAIWVHIRESEDELSHTIVSIYGTRISFEQAKNLAVELNCVILTDFDPELKQYQWQQIKKDGSVEVVYEANI